MNPVVAFGLLAAVVAAPELVDLAVALKGTPGRRRRHVSRWWLGVAVVVPHVLLVPAGMWGVS